MVDARDRMFKALAKWKRGTYILLSIREGRIKTIEDIYAEIERELGGRGIVFSGNSGPSIKDIINDLEEAGLIEIKDGQFVVTPRLSKIQSVLGISLSFLLTIKRDTLLVNPFFGEPRRPPIIPDVFVLMPFSEELKPVYDDHIKVVASQLGLTTARSDDFFASSLIMSDVWDAINISQIIIADCTGRNPNVFYEIGIAHTIGKPTILISQNIEDIPFDLRHIRYILYQYTPRGMYSLEQSLYKTLETEMARVASEDP